MHLSTLEEILQHIPYAAILLLSSSQKSNRFLGIINRRLVRYLKKCVLIYISMSIIKKVLSHEETELIYFHTQGL